MTLPWFALISSGLTPTLHPSLNRKCLSLVENDLLFFRVTNALFLMKQKKKTHKAKSENSQNATAPKRLDISLAILSHRLFSVSPCASRPPPPTNTGAETQSYRHGCTRPLLDYVFTSQTHPGPVLRQVPRSPCLLLRVISSPAPHCLRFDYRRSL